MKESVKYVFGLTAGCIALNVWFMAINAPHDFQAIYAALAGILSAIITIGRNKDNKNDKRKKL